MAVTANGTHVIFNDNTTQSTAAVSGGGFSNMSIYTSPGTFNIPPTTTKLKVTLVGGGAGQSGGAGTFHCPCSTITPGGAGGTGGTGGTTSFGAYATATGGTVTSYGTSPASTLIVDGKNFGKFGSSIAAQYNQILGRGGFGVKILEGPFPVTSVPITVGSGGGGGGGGGNGGGNPGAQASQTGFAGQAANGSTAGNGGNGGAGIGGNSGGSGGGGGGGAAGSVNSTGANGAAGGSPGGLAGQAGQTGATTFTRIGGGFGGAAGGNGPGSGGNGGYSGVVIVEY